MIDLSGYNLTIGRSGAIDDWFAPVLERGRGASFVDTGFLRALLYDRDQYASRARAHFSAAIANFYTTNLVLAEIVRQISKGGDNYGFKSQILDGCHHLLFESNSIFVCAPPREFVVRAITELRESYPTDHKLDLCDLLSVAVLDYANHKRVFGFDSHFSSIYGAQLEP